MGCVPLGPLPAPQSISQGCARVFSVGSLLTYHQAALLWEGTIPLICPLAADRPLPGPPQTKGALPGFGKELHTPEILFSPLPPSRLTHPQ